MKEYLELGKNGQLTLPPSICRAAKIQEGNLLRAVIAEDGSIHLIVLATKERKLVEQSQLKDIRR
jgi:hypothetical protein